MAPLTRRRARLSQASEIADSTQTSRQTSPEPTFTEIPMSARKSRRKESPTSGTPKPQKVSDQTKPDGEAENQEEPQQSASTPRPQKLAVRVHNQEDEEGVQQHISVEAHILPSGDQQSKAEPTATTEEAKNEETKKPSDAETGEAMAAAEEDKEALTPFTPSMLNMQLEAEANQRLSFQQQLNAEGPESTPAPKPKGKSTHITFGDDDDVESYVATAAAAGTKAPEASQDDKEDENQEDSDDEAPEAVSTQAAAKVAMKSAQDAADAAEKQAAELRRKRQERDNLLKQQAGKRKRDSQKAEKLKRSLAVIGEEEEPADEHERSGRRRSKYNVPETLPAEFLTDSESSDEDEKALKVVKKPKKINFEEVEQELRKEGRRPRDEVVGSTAYRVVADLGEKNQAPRAHKNSRLLKEQLLRRDRAGVSTGKSKGFFKKR